MNALVKGKSMISTIYIHKPIDWLGESLPENERIIFLRMKSQILEFLSVETLNTQLMLKIIDEVNQNGISMYILKEIVELIRIRLLSNNSKKVYLTITLADALVKNCGTKIHVLIGDELFMKTLSKISRVWLKGFGSKSKMVGDYGLDTIQAWGEGFESRKYLYPHIYATYTRLRSKTYIKFPGIQYDPRRVPIFLGPISQNEKQFVADYLLENQQMEDIDLLYFSESDDEVDMYHQEQQANPSHPSNDQDQHDSILSQLKMDTDYNLREESTSQPQSQHDIDSFWEMNSGHQSYSESKFVQENVRNTFIDKHIEGFEPSYFKESNTFDWDQLNSMSKYSAEDSSDHRIVSTEIGVQTDENDRFHYFDEVFPDAPNLFEVVSSINTVSPSPHDQFATLDPFQDTDSITSQKYFSKSQKQKTDLKPFNDDPFLAELSSKIQKDENDFNAVNNSDTKPTAETLGSSADAQISSSRSTTKPSSYHDPSSDPKNRVVFYGTQRVIRREASPSSRDGSKNKL